MPEPTEFTLWEYAEHPGSPPDGEPGYFLGFAEGRRPFILTWHPGHGAWVGVGFDPDCGTAPYFVMRAEKTPDLIKSYARLPWVEGVEG